MDIRICEQSNCYQDLCDNFFVFTLPGVCLNDCYYQGIYSKYVVHELCKLKLPFLCSLSVGQIYFRLVFLLKFYQKFPFHPILYCGC